jgi:hypothetical protein
MVPLGKLQFVKPTHTCHGEALICCAGVGRSLVGQSVTLGEPNEGPLVAALQKFRVLPERATSGPSGSQTNDGLPKTGSWPRTYGKNRTPGNYRSPEARLTDKRLVRMTNPVGMFYLAGISAVLVDHPASFGSSFFAGPRSEEPRISVWLLR